MLRVMYVGHTAKPSGGEIALSRLLPALADRIQSLVVLAEDGPMVERFRALGAEVLVEPLRGRTKDLRKESLASPIAILSRLLSVVAYAWRLRRLIRDRHVDLVHTNTLKAGVYGCLAARLAGVPSVWHLRDRLSPDYLPRLGVLGTRAAIAVLPRRVICNSAATMATLPRGMPRLLRRALVVPSPIHDVLDAEATVQPGPAPSRDAGFRVGMVGRLAPWKGQLEALRAFAQAGLEPPGRLVFVGSAMFGEEAYERQLREEIHRLGLDDAVRLEGFVDDVFGVLRTFDVLVHASTVPEPFGQVIVEGMAAGVPVVATRGGGPSEIVTDGENGLLYDAGDTEALASLLRRLQEDGALRERLRKGGFRRAADFSAQSIAPVVLRLYADITSG